MAHGVVQAARRLAEALRSINRSQCGTAVAESSSTLLPRYRRLSAVRAPIGELARVPGASFVFLVGLNDDEFALQSLTEERFTGDVETWSVWSKEKDGWEFLDEGEWPTYGTK